MPAEGSEVKNRGQKNGHNKKTTDEGGRGGRGGGGKPRPRGRREESDEVSLSDAEQYIPSPPDGGWGWVIVGASLMCNFVVDGIGYAFGVFLLEFEDYFGESKSKISLVGSLLCGVYLFAGPIVSAMTNKLGCRPVVIAGSILSTVAFVLATFCKSVDGLIITYGCMGGFGFGMMYLPAIVSVGFYFEKRRALATGLAVAGSGVGTFIFPPLTEFLVGLYGWQGSILILAGIVFNCVICGMLMRPLEAKPMKRRALEDVREESSEDEDEDDKSAGQDRRISESIATGAVPIPMTDARRYKTSIGSSYADSTAGSPAAPKMTIDLNMEVRVSAPDDKQLAGSHEQPDGSSTDQAEYTTPPETIPTSPVTPADADGPTSEPGNSGMDSTVLSMRKMSTASKGTINSVSHFASEVLPLMEVPAPHVHNGDAAPGYRTRAISIGNRSHLHSIRSLHLSKGNVANLSISKKDLARPLYRKDIFFSGSTPTVNQVHSQAEMKSYIASITSIPGEREMVDSLDGSSNNCMEKLCGCLPRPVRDILGEMVDLSLLKDISFMLICLGNFTAFLGFFSPFVFLVDVAVSLGIDKSNAAFLISIIGIANTIGRILAGKLADTGWVSSLVITWVSIFICGIATIIIPYCTNYTMLAIVAFVFGSGVAAYISLSSVIICDQLGLDKLTNAFGLMCLTRGTAGMIGPPFAGYLYDSTGSYHFSFLLGGMLLFTGALCHMLLHLPCLRNRKDDHEIVYGDDDDEVSDDGMV